MVSAIENKPTFSPVELIQNFKTTPWDTYAVRKERMTFEITEDIPPTKKFRMVKVTGETKAGVKFESDKFAFKVQSGLIEKDLALTKHELQSLILLIPPGWNNLKGTTFKCDGMQIEYVCTNNTGAPQAPAQQSQQADQRDAQVARLKEAITFSASLGTPVVIQILTKIAENVAPGKALDLIMYAKTKGEITEGDDKIYRCV